MLCATPMTNVPAPKGKDEVAEVRKRLDIKAAASGAKLPIPPRRSTKPGASASKPRTVEKDSPEFKAAAEKAKAAPAAKKNAEDAAGRVLNPLAATALVDDPKKAGVPVELQHQNRKPLTAEQKEKLESVMKNSNARTAVKPAAKTKAATPKKKGESKTDMIGSMLKRKNGCTTKEVLAATGWPAVSMPQQAKAAGLKLKKVKAEGQPTRYFAA